MKAFLIAPSRFLLSCGYLGVVPGGATIATLILAFFTLFAPQSMAVLLILAGVLLLFSVVASHLFCEDEFMIKNSIVDDVSGWLVAVALYGALYTPSLEPMLLLLSIYRTIAVLGVPPLSATIFNRLLLKQLSPVIAGLIALLIFSGLVYVYRYIISIITFP